MKKIRLAMIWLTLILIFCLSGCSINEYKTLKQENKEVKLENEFLRQENESLKQKIDEIEFGSEKIFNKIMIKYEEKDYSAVKANIDLLLDKHPDSQEAIKAKEMLVDIEKIMNAEAIKKEKEEIERLKEATKKMIAVNDEVTSITWYYDNELYIMSANGSIYLYFGTKKGSTPWLRFAFNYRGSSWLFVEKITVKADDTVFTYNPDYNDFERNSGASRVTERYDISPSDKDIEMIEKIIKSTKTIIRFHGDDEIYDHVVDEREIEALRNVLDAYKAFEGSAAIYDGKY